MNDKIDKICLFCKSKFTIYKSCYKRKYCCRECSSKAKIGITGYWKGKKFSKEHIEKLKNNHIGTLGFRHSNETKIKQSDGNKLKGEKRPEISGEKHPNWKGGITPINQKIRGSLEYKTWEDSVYKRDGYKCVVCEENRKSKITSHHIKNFAQYPELRFVTDNGITMCRKHHQEFHKIYGRKNNNEEQLKEFYNTYKKYYQ